MTRILNKHLIKPEFGLVLTPDEQTSLARAIERAGNLSTENPLTEEGSVGSTDSIIWCWCLYLQTLEMETKHKAGKGPVNELQQMALTRRRFISTLKLNLGRTPKAEDLTELLNLDATDNEILGQLVAEDIKHVQQTIRPHLSFEEKLASRLDKERKTKRRAQYRARKVAREQARRRERVGD